MRPPPRLRPDGRQLGRAARSGYAPPVAWAVVVGAKGEPRAEAALRLASLLRARGLRVGGFVARRVEGQGLVVEDLGSGARVPLGVPDEVDPDFCGWRFEAGGFETAAGWVGAAGLDVAILGGIGPLEAAGRGHWELVRRTVEEGRALPILVVRSDALATVALALPGEPLAGLELPADDAEMDGFVAAIAGSIRPRPPGAS